MDREYFGLMRVAWNSVVKDKGSLRGYWDDMIQNGDDLQKLRAKQMISLTDAGEIHTNVDEMLSKRKENTRKCEQSENK